MTQKSSNATRVRIFFAVLGLVFLALSALELFAWSNPGRALMNGGCAIIWAVAPHVNLELIWKSRDQAVSKNIREQGLELVPMRFVPLLLLAMVCCAVGFFMQLPGEMVG